MGEIMAERNRLVKYIITEILAALAPEVEQIEQEMADEPDDDEPRLKDMECPQCRKAFVLIWNDYSDKRQTLFMRGCPSGGIYDVAIKCPHCNYEEPL